MLCYYYNIVSLIILNMIVKIKKNVNWIVIFTVN